VADIYLTVGGRPKPD